MFYLGDWLLAAAGLAACGTTQPGPMYQGGSPMIDVPTPPFPATDVLHLKGDDHVKQPVRSCCRSCARW